MNLRETVNNDLRLTCESPDDWGLPVTLRSPSGDIQSKTVVHKSSDLFFQASDNSVNSTDTDFRDLKVSTGEELKFIGSVNNTAESYTVSSIAKNKIVLEESIVDESAGTSIQILNQDMPLNGQVLYDTVEQDSDTGVDQIMHKPVVTLRRDSLVTIPAQDEKNQWLVSIPLTPSQTATLQPYIMDRPGETGGSIGFIRLYLSRPVQAS